MTDLIVINMEKNNIGTPRRPVGRQVSLSSVMGTNNAQSSETTASCSRMVYSRKKIVDPSDDRIKELHQHMKEIILMNTEMSVFCQQLSELVLSESEIPEIIISLASYAMWEGLNVFLKTHPVTFSIKSKHYFADLLHKIINPRWLNNDKRFLPVTMPPNHSRSMFDVYQTMCVIFEYDVGVSIEVCDNTRFNIEKFVNEIITKKSISPVEINILLQCVSSKNVNCLEQSVTKNILPKQLIPEILINGKKLNGQMFNSFAYMFESIFPKNSFHDEYEKLYDIMFNNLSDHRKYNETNITFNKFCWDITSLDQYHDNLCWLLSVAPRHVALRLLDMFTWHKQTEKKKGIYKSIDTCLHMFLNSFSKPPNKYSVYTKFFSEHIWSKDNLIFFINELFNCIPIINEKHSCYDIIGAVMGSLVGYCYLYIPEMKEYVIEWMTKEIYQTLKDINLREIDVDEVQKYGGIVTAIVQLSNLIGNQITFPMGSIIKNHVGDNANSTLGKLPGGVKWAVIDILERFGLK